MARVTDAEGEVAIIGCGLIGQSWGIVFARANRRVALFDPAPGVAAQAQAAIIRHLTECDARDAGATQARIRVAGSLADAVADSAYVQENGPERLDAKAALTAEIDAAAPSDTPIGSSTSGLPTSAYAADAPGRRRCLVAHPINPPHLIPAVEIAPAPWTDPAVSAQVDAIMTAVGQATIRVHREVEGFVVNRLQGALLSEAFRLVADGVVSPRDLDTAVSHGLGLRWSFMGPFETIHLNAPGGVAQYAERYGPMYHRLFGGDAASWRRVLEEGLTAWLEETHPLETLRASQAARDAKLLALWRHRFGSDTASMDPQR